MRPEFRELKPGEQRVEGTLERIECVVGKGVTFHVKTPAGAVTATAPQFNDVAFITYRKDLTGSIQCGPVTGPMPVYLTWRPGADGAKTAVAIEFLPLPLGAPSSARDDRAYFGERRYRSKSLSVPRTK